MRICTRSFLILALIAFAVPVGGQDFETVEYGEFTVRINHEEPETVKAYWTPEQMESAIPMERTVEVDPVSYPAVLEPTTVGPPGMLPGGLPGTIPQATSMGKARVTPLQIDTKDDAFTHPSPFTRYFPVYGNFQDLRRAQGKLFFTKPSGGTFVCSGAVVTSAITGGGGPGNGDLVATAAHCCADTDGFFTNFLFAPAYTNGQTPFDTWTDRNAAVATVWLNTENLSRDVCMLVMNNNGSGQNISQVTGFYGFAWNQSRLQHWHAGGWPAASPFNGQRLVFAVSTFAHIDDVIDWENFPNPGDCPGCPQPHSMGSDLTGGSSGGPWLLGYCHNIFCGSGPFINGVNSFKYTNPSWPLWMFAPYFDDFINGLREFAAAL